MFAPLLFAPTVLVGCYSTDSYIQYVPNLMQATLFLVKAASPPAACSKFPLGVDVYLDMITSLGVYTDEVWTFDDFNFTTTQSLVLENALIDSSLDLTLVTISTYAESTQFYVSQLLSVEFSIAGCFKDQTIVLERDKLTFSSIPTGLCNSQIDTSSGSGLQAVYLQIGEYMIEIPGTAAFVYEIGHNYTVFASNGVKMSVIDTSQSYSDVYTMQVDYATLIFVCLVDGNSIKASARVTIEKKHAIMTSVTAWGNGSSLTLLLFPKLDLLPANIGKIAFSVLLRNTNLNTNTTFVYSVETLDQRYITSFCTGNQAEISVCQEFMYAIAQDSTVTADVSVKYYSGTQIVAFDRLAATLLVGPFSRALLEHQGDTACLIMRYESAFTSYLQLFNFIVAYYHKDISRAANDGVLRFSYNVTRDLDKLCFPCTDYCLEAYNSESLFCLTFGAMGVFSLEKQKKSYLAMQVVTFLFGGITLALCLSYSIIGVVYLQKRLKAAKKKKLK